MSFNRISINVHIVISPRASAQIIPIGSCNDYNTRCCVRTIWYYNDGRIKQNESWLFIFFLFLLFTSTSFNPYTCPRVLKQMGSPLSYYAATQAHIKLGSIYKYVYIHRHTTTTKLQLYPSATNTPFGDFNLYNKYRCERIQSA